MRFDFDAFLDRRNTSCFKWDGLKRTFGRDDLLPMWVADMDFPCAPTIIESMKQRLSHPAFGYTFTPDSALASVVKWLDERHLWQVAEKDIIFIPGVIPGLVLSIHAFTQPGENVMIQSPVYHPFYDVIENNHRNLVLNPLIEEEGYYTMDFSLLEDQLKDGCKMIFLCSPHNPVGRVWKLSELDTLVSLCSKYDTIVVSDEIHFDIVFRGKRHFPFPLAAEGMLDRVIFLSAPSKTFNIPGLCTAYAVIPDSTLRKQFIRTARRYAQGMTGVMGSVALEAAYSEGIPWLTELLVYLEGNVNTALKLLSGSNRGIRAFRPEGTFLLWLDFRNIGLSPQSLRELMTGEAGLALSDGREFGHGGEGFQRMNLGCSRYYVEDAFKRINAALDTL